MVAWATLERVVAGEGCPLEDSPLLGGGAALGVGAVTAADVAEPAEGVGRACMGVADHIVPEGVEMSEQMVGRVDAEALEHFGAELGLDSPHGGLAVPAGSAVGTELGAGFLALLPVDGEELFGLVVDADQEGVAGSKDEAGTANVPSLLAGEDPLGHMKALDPTGAGNEPLFVFALECDAGGVGTEVEAADPNFVGGVPHETGDEGLSRTDGVCQRRGTQAEGVERDDSLEVIAIGADAEGEVRVGQPKLLTPPTTAAELKEPGLEFEAAGLIRGAKSAVELDQAGMGQLDAGGEGEPVGTGLEERGSWGGVVFLERSGGKWE